MWYTGKGDTGKTGLLAGERVEKDAPRIEALGELDEMTSSIGMARSLVSRPDIHDRLLNIQHDLLLLMTEVASTHPAELPERFNDNSVHMLEADIARWGDQIELQSGFILPGECPASAALDLARAITRRAERRMVSLARQENIHFPHLLCYLNRLSTMLYILARAEEQSISGKDVGLRHK